MSSGGGNLIQRLGNFFAPTRFPLPPVFDETKTMKAIVINEHGGPEVMKYTDFPTFLEESNQIIVDVIAAGLNPVDFKLRKGPLPSFLYPKPKILGSDMVGVIRHLPPGGDPTGRLQVGDRVYAMLPFLGVQTGSYAEKCTVDENILVKIPSSLYSAPSSLPFAVMDLASIPLVATTVIQALRPVKEFYKDQKEFLKTLKIFIPSGSGGLGTFAIQYCANELGMYVTTSCSVRNKELMISLGAKEVIDYHSEHLKDRLFHYDIVLDSMGYQYEELILSKDSQILKPSTKENPSFYLRIASSPYGDKLKTSNSLSEDPLGMAIPEARIDRMIVSFSKQFISSWGFLPNGIRYHFILVSPEREALEEATQAICKGNIRPIIQERIPLQDAIRAHQILEEGHVTGKLILVINANVENEILPPS